MAVQIPISSSAAGSSLNASFGPDNAHDGETVEGEQGAGGAGGHAGNHWLSAELTFTETITFDLDLAGAPTGWNVTSVDILNTSNTAWNDSETDEFGLEVSTDGGSSYTSVVDDGTPFGVYYPDVKTVAVNLSNITNIRLNVTNDPAIGPLTGASPDVRVGLNEVTVFGNLVPEPSTLVLLSTAAGMLLLGRRRRRRIIHPPC